MDYLVFDRQLLLDTLVEVKPGLANKDVVAQASKFVFKGKAVYTYNDEIAVMHPIEHDLTGAVPSTELYDLLNKMTDTEVSIAIEGTTMHIKGLKLTASILIQDEILLPMTDLQVPSIWSPVPPDFTDALTFSLLSVGTDLSKPILTCVHWTQEYMESCDNFRLTRYTMSTPELAEPILLSNKVVSNLKNYTPTHFSIEPGWAHFKTKAGCVFSCKVYSGTFVDLSSIFTTVYDKSITFTDAVVSLLDRVLVLADRDIHGNSKANLNVTGGIATVSATGPLGNVTESTRIKSDSDILFEFKIETLMHILQHSKRSLIDTNKKSLQFTDGKKWVHVVSLC